MDNNRIIFRPLLSKTVLLRHYKVEKLFYCFWNYRQPYDMDFVVTDNMSLDWILQEVRIGFNINKNIKLYTYDNIVINNIDQLRAGGLYLVV